jgi:hypothetical protein
MRVDNIYVAGGRLGPFAALVTWDILWLITFMVRTHRAKYPDGEVPLKYASRVFAYRPGLYAEASAANLSICNSVR